MAPVPPLPRIVIYHQTTHSPSGEHISLLPLITKPSCAPTHIILAALHINDDPSAITLNDHPPSHERYTTLWAEARVLQASGIQVLVMLGGAAPGTYARLDADEATFERYFIPVRDMIRQRGLNGIDLDVEEPMSLSGIVRLVDRIRADFGQGFIITLAPVFAALLDVRRNLSGFDYEALEVMRGRDIAWYNTQFYCGWGDATSWLSYAALVARGWPAHKTVMGLVTNPENGSGFVPFEILAQVLRDVRGQFGVNFGGVMGWEYFNSLPLGKEGPWEWSRWMGSALRNGLSADASSSATAAPTATMVNESKTKVWEEIDPDLPDAPDAPVPGAFEYNTDSSDEER